MSALKRLEASANEADSLIATLAKQIRALKTAQNSSGSKMSYEEEIALLRSENQRLKREIDEWKVKLCDAEKKSGAGLPTIGNAGEYHPHSNGFVKPNAAMVNGDLQPESKPKTNENEKKAAEQPKKLESKSKPKQDTKPKPAKSAPKQQPAAEAPVDVGRLDMRVGVIVSAKKHPDADALYVEQVDVGEEKPRTVISGLVKFIPLEEMQNRRAILLCNLKPSKMRGILSEAMVMCASTPDKVEILTPPANAKPGDRVLVDGFESRPDAQLNPKKKVFETCAPDLRIDADKVAMYKGVPWTVNGEKCYSQTLVNVQIK